ncbi:LOW QUALITY PROTEIN: cyclin-P [Sceloporus undulatus]|uniref:LOW QUALITY PROTEIN: cyclin-P n=1 Tax=Sceloporus undulatus TaxID=8520 RepID=UPI001C4B9A84|nr:LOW QUALITY PROTEIN: cyclin-P [Sceloporus undulatus]
MEAADEKREPLKSKDNKGLNSEQGSRKKKAPGNHEKEFASEKLGAICPRTLLEAPLQRVVPVSESLAEELSQAMLRMDMGLEREYAYDIFSSMMKQQLYAFQAFDLPRSITAEMRALVIDWLVQVHEYLGLLDETLYLTVYLMNGYMRAGKVRIRSLQLLGIACLFLACKVEDSTCPEPAQLCFMTGDSFSRKELLRMERKILTRLKFELHYANPVHLLRWLAEVTHSTLELRYLAQYFLELSVMEVDCVRFEPAQLALAALHLAQRLLLQEPGLREMEMFQESFTKLHSYSEYELSAVYPYMAKAALRGPSAPLHAIFLKYSRPHKLCVSTSAAITASEYLSRCLGSPIA